MRAHELAGRLGITQTQLARALGISVRTIYRWQDGTEPIGLALEILTGIDDALEAGADPRRVGRDITRGMRHLVAATLIDGSKR